MSADRVNYLNIGLMVLSLAAACVLPFEVFLFSYAVLGPLHYLTEISWLHDRRYFSPGRWDALVLLGFAFLFLLSASALVFGEGATAWMVERGGEPLLAFLARNGADVALLAFGSALVFVLTQRTYARIGGLALLLLAAYLFHVPEDPVFAVSSQADMDAYVADLNARWMHPYFAFAVYLPTLLHVYVFTGAFLLYGALKRSSRSGYAAFGVFVVCALACFMIPPIGTQPTAWAQTNYAGPFVDLSLALLLHVGGLDWGDLARMGRADQAFLFTDALAIAAARFIAFAYTYHYLNWFSKTEVIRWHDVPRARLIGVGVVWAISVGLFFYDYAVGFRWLFFLSFAHVVLEFPLNHKSFLGIGNELARRVRTFRALSQR